MLDTDIKIGFMGKKVSERLDNSLVSIYGLVRTGQFYYQETVLFKHKRKDEILVGIYEEDINNAKYVWCQVYSSPVKILLTSDSLELIN